MNHAREKAVRAWGRRLLELVVKLQGVLLPYLDSKDEKTKS